MRGNNVMKGYYPDPEATAAGLRRRLVPLGRHRRDAPRRLHRAPRPQEGHHHQRRREHLDDRGRAHAREAPGRARVRGGRDAATRSGARCRRPSSRCVPGAPLSEQELIDFCRERLAHFKCPKAIEFGELPKTSTGKIQKFRLREKEWAGRGEADPGMRRARLALQPRSRSRRRPFAQSPDQHLARAITLRDGARTESAGRLRPGAVRGAPRLARSPPSRTRAASRAREDRRGEPALHLARSRRLARADAADLAPRRGARARIPRRGRTRPSPA